MNKIYEIRHFVEEYSVGKYIRIILFNNVNITIVIIIIENAMY